MAQGLRSLVESGTKVWLDSIDPDFLRVNRDRGATGATSNPIIVSDILKSGRYDADLARLAGQGFDDEAIAWQLTDMLVRQAQEIFLSVHQSTHGDDGYVSFELDPLIEDTTLNLPHAERVRRYMELGKQWCAGHANRMIKVPATPAGIDSLEALAAHGITLNVTLIFTPRQYRMAREAVWRGAQKRANFSVFKSVYSVFVSRVDVYTEKHVSQLSAAAQGQVGIVLAKRMWRENQDFWAAEKLPLKQEIIFASTGTKKPEDDPAKYVAALAGSDIETNPPATNEAVESSGRTITRAVDQMPADAVLREIDGALDLAKLEEVLMREGVAKFADPHKGLLKLIGEKRAALGSLAARR
ncbi:MAG: transaldolase [Acidobacteria bacterium]|nr:transaldolase [Acidobacteriota bacterium]